MRDHVSDTEANNEPTIQKTDTKINFLALVSNVLPIPAEPEKDFAPHSIRCPTESIRDPDRIAIGSILELVSGLLWLHVRDCNRRDALVTKAAQRLPYNFRGREFGIIIDRKDDLA
jgi:hypothetical protein